MTCSACTDDIYLGGAALVRAQFFDQDSVAFTPDPVSCTIMSPSGVVTVYTVGVDAEIEVAGVGIIELTFVPNEVGRWWYRFVGEDSDGVPGASEGSFKVSTRFS